MLYVIYVLSVRTYRQLKQSEADQLECRLLLLKNELQKSSKHIQQIKQRRIQVEKHRARLNDKYQQRIDKLNNQHAINELVHEYYIANKNKQQESKQQRNNTILTQRTNTAQLIKQQSKQLANTLKSDQQQRIQRNQVIHEHVKSTLETGRKLRIQSLAYKKENARILYSQQLELQQSAASAADTKLRVLEQAEAHMIELLAQTHELQLDEYNKLQQSIQHNQSMLKQNDSTLKQTQQLLLQSPPVQSRLCTPTSQSKLAVATESH